MLASWRQITKKGSIIGNIGQTSSHPSITWIPSSQTSPLPNESNSSLPLLNMSATVAAVADNKQVRAGTVQVAVCAIGKTFEMDRRPNPLYCAKGRYWLPLERQIEGYQCQDPPSQCKLAIPISLVEYLVKLGASSNSPKLQATCDACTITFYYLLHVSKYTSHHHNDCHCKQEF